MHSWQLQEAKARFSEVVKCAATEGPQEITVRGEPAAVVLSIDEYLRLAVQKPPLTRFLDESPLSGLSLDIERDRSTDREVSL